MKKIIVATLLLWSITGYAGQKAITDTGDVVILNDDGTWVYSDDAKKTTSSIGTNKRKFLKPKDSSFLLKSKINNSAFWVNTHRWTFGKGDAADIEYKFRLKGKSLYGMAITEEISMPVVALADIALANMKDVAPDAKMVRQEYRFVNGKKLLYMEINGTIRGIQYSYRGYYYSNDYGVTQFLTYTGTNLVSKYTSEINDFLNGFVTQ